MPDNFAIPTGLQDQIDDLIIQYGKSAVLAAVGASDRKAAGRPRKQDAPHLIAMAMILESDPGANRWAVARQMAHGLKGHPDDSEARRLYNKFKKNERWYRRYARKIKILFKIRDQFYDIAQLLVYHKLSTFIRLHENIGDPLKAGERAELQSRASELDRRLETLRKIETYVFNRSAN